MDSYSITYLEFELCGHSILKNDFLLLANQYENRVAKILVGIKQTQNKPLKMARLVCYKVTIYNTNSN